MEEKLTLTDFAGQARPVVITKRLDGTKFVTFKYTEGYGYPLLQEQELEDLLQRVKDL